MGKMAISSDGESWTAVWTKESDSPFYTGWGYNSSIFGIAYGNGKFIAVGDEGKMAYANW
jgi:hypothetical protein